MKKTALFLLFSLFLITACDHENDDDVNVEPCGGEKFMYYKIDGGSKIEIDAYTAKLLIGQGADGDAYDIWSDDRFYLHTSTTELGTYQYVVDYHTESGVNLFIPGVIDPFNALTTNISIQFVIDENGTEVGDCIHITFNGTYTDANGNHTISGELQIQLDIIHS